MGVVGVVVGLVDGDDFSFGWGGGIGGGDGVVYGGIGVLCLCR